MITTVEGWWLGLKVKHIQKFLFGTANYHISDDNGDFVLLSVDYKNNDFSIERSGKKLDEGFYEEISAIARDLLRRKHGVNIAERD